MRLVLALVFLFQFSALKASDGIPSIETSVYDHASGQDTVVETHTVFDGPINILRNVARCTAGAVVTIPWIVYLVFGQPRVWDVFLHS